MSEWIKLQTLSPELLKRWGRGPGGGDGEEKAFNRSSRMQQHARHIRPPRLCGPQCGTHLIFSSRLTRTRIMEHVRGAILVPSVVCAHLRVSLFHTKQPLQHLEACQRRHPLSPKFDAGANLPPKIERTMLGIRKKGSVGTACLPAHSSETTCRERRKPRLVS
jgi:hypothetical protein